MEQNSRKVGRPRQFDEAKTRATLRSVFWEQGYDATSLDRLSQATGLHKPSLYAAFGNKQEIFAAALDSYLVESGRRNTAALAAPRLADALNDHFTSMRELTTTRGCFLLGVAVPLAASDEALAARVRSAMRTLESRFEKRLEQGRLDDELAPMFDARTAASLLIATVARLTMEVRIGTPHDEVESIWRGIVALIAPA